jgi:translation elongation factor EF-4
LVKKRMHRLDEVDIPQEAFIAALKWMCEFR